MKGPKGQSRSEFRTARCRVLGCANQKNAPKKSTSLFRVPKKRPELEKWVQLVGNKELLDVPLYHVRKNMRVCQEHFQPSEIIRCSTKSRLVNLAHPSIFPDGHSPLSDDSLEQWRSSKPYLMDKENEPQEPQPSTSNSATSYVPQQTGHQDEVMIVTFGNGQDVGVNPPDPSRPAFKPSIQAHAPGEGPFLWNLSGKEPTVSLDWAQECLVTHVGNRLIAIPCWSTEAQHLQ